MKHIIKKHQFFTNIDFPYQETLFFDIETTGLNHKYNYIYIIGFIVFNTKSEYETHILLSESKNEEKQLIETFNTFLNKYNIICHFNGQTFDLPFLTKRSNIYDINLNLNTQKFVDLYREFRFLKTPLSLQNMKQKTLEKFLDWSRDDKFSGGELIKVYFDYIQTGNIDLENLLVLHNEDDLKGMLLLTNFYSYSALFKENIKATNIIRQGETLILNAKLNLALFKKTSLNHKEYTIDINDIDLTLKTKVIKNKLKHFLKDYKSYYYLPIEDTVVHKSVGKFVDKNFRQQATSSTCYINLESEFIWSPYTDILPTFKQEFSHKENFIEFKKLNSENSSSYLNLMLQNLL